MGLGELTLQQPKIEIYSRGFLGILGSYGTLNGQQGQGPVKARIEKTGKIERASVEMIALALSQAYVRTSRIIHARKKDDNSKVVGYGRNGEMHVASVTGKDGYFEVILKRSDYVSPYDVLRDVRF